MVKWNLNKKNGKGKIKIYSDNGELIFEGEYLNGEKNGNGKEYDYNSGKLRFEGKYLNGEKNGKGKEYYTNDKLKFEGELFKRRKKWKRKRI